MSRPDVAVYTTDHGYEGEPKFVIIEADGTTLLELTADEAADLAEELALAARDAKDAGA